MIAYESDFVTCSILKYADMFLAFKASVKGESKATPPKLGIISVIFLLKVVGQWDCSIN